jgi:hypothetical protein
MKKAVIIIFVSTFAYNMLFGQSLSFSEKGDNVAIYGLILEKYLRENYSHKGGKDSTILVEYNFLFANKLPKKNGNYKIESVSINKKFLKRKKSKVDFLRVVPLRFREGFFIITIIEMEATFIKKTIRQTNKGGKEYEFTYDCSKNILINSF